MYPTVFLPQLLASYSGFFVTFFVAFLVAFAFCRSFCRFFRRFCAFSAIFTPKRQKKRHKKRPKKRQKRPKGHQKRQLLSNWGKKGDNTAGYIPSVRCSAFSDGPWRHYPLLIHFFHNLGLMHVVTSILWDNLRWFILVNNHLGAVRRNGHPFMAYYHLTLELEARPSVP